MIRLLSCAVLLVAGAACAGAQRPDPAAPAPPATGNAGADSTAGAIPAGYGSLRQEDIAIKLQPTGFQMKAIPLNESIIRTLSPDSYRALQGLLDSRRADVERIAQRTGAGQPSVWYISFYGVEPNAQFNPLDIVITSSGRDYRPIDLVPLTGGFGEHLLSQREMQAALYIFEPGIEVSQPLTLSYGFQRSDEWGRILRTVERERALVRSRANVARP